MIPMKLTEAKVGDLLIRRSLAIDIPVVVTKIEKGKLYVSLRPEQLENNIKMMQLGMDQLGETGNAEELIRKVEWVYDIETSMEINPPLLPTILLKAEQ